MKKLLIITNLITLVILYFAGCVPHAVTTSNNAFITKDNNTLLLDYRNKQFNGLSSDLIKDAVKNYKNSTTYPYAPSNPIGTSDSRSVWFNLDVLKKFIWTVETQSVKNGFNKYELEGLGLRLYYIRYPQESFETYGADLDGVPRKFQDKHSILMVPTYYDPESQTCKEFDPKEFTGGKPTPFKELLKDSLRRLTVMPFVYRTTGLGFMTVQNHGDLTPPFNPGYNGADLLEYADNH